MNDQELIKFACEKCNAAPPFKLKYFVGGAQLTPYGTLKQWLMELRAREESVAALEYQMKKHALEIKQEKEKLEFASTDIQKELIELEIENKTKDHIRFERNVRDAYTEKNSLLELVKEFIASDQAKLPDGTNLMDVFGNKEVEAKLESEYWTTRMAKQAALDVMFYGRVNEGNMDSILMMEPKQTKQVLQLAMNHALEWDRGLAGLKHNAAKRLDMIDPEGIDYEELQDKGYPTGLLSEEEGEVKDNG
jgi:predicted Rossmann fold nucleotide-binding protein DprA/Smf involved in DNA uptake